MKHLIKHLVHEHLPEIAAKSLLNCHVQGLHSIMLIDTPERRVRLFITDETHQLHLNTCNNLGSLAAHAHHCNITLHMVQGAMVNLEYILHPRGDLQAYYYTSGILNEQGSFDQAEVCPALFEDARMLEAGMSLHLPAHLIHSVQVNEGMVAAWFVYEGAKDPAYQSYSYSNNNLEQSSFAHLYKPMSEERVVSLLKSVNLL